MRLSQRLLNSFEHHAHRPCIEIGEDLFSYADVLGRAMALITAMNAADPHHRPLAVMGNRTLASYVAVLSCLLSERTYVPLNPKFPRERQRSILRRSDSRLLVADDPSTEIARTLADETPNCRVLDANGPGLMCSASIGSADPARPGTPAYVMFTSGTTGEPKGVMVLPENLCAYVDAFALLAPVHPDDRCTQLFDLSFDLSVHDLLVTFLSGACLVAFDPQEMIDPVGVAARRNISCWFSVPSVAAMAKRFRRLRPGVLPQLRLALFCGEALPASLARDWQAAAPVARTLNVYGPTEATIAITAYDLSAGIPDDEAVTPIGMAYPGSETIVVDGSLWPLPSGTIGELLLGGPQVTAGYLSNPEVTAAKFVSAHFAGRKSDRWYRSGDLAIETMTGLLYRGRLDEQVQVNGFRVEVAEVEECARGAVEGDVAVVAIPSADGTGHTLAAAIVGAYQEHSVTAHCRKYLPDYMIPMEMISVEALPLNANGKVDRGALRAMVVDTRARRG